MAELKVAIGLLKLPELFGGDLKRCLASLQIADQVGIDQLSITDHVVMGEQLDAYPYGKFPLPLTFPWYEPISVLSAVAMVTQRIRLSMGVLIGPLRPAVLLAKQLATLDVLSGGRVDAGIGTGWQREEYTAAGIAFEERYLRMDEQVRVCRLLWSEAPASFSGKTVSFDNLHAFPRPPQGTALPFWFGVAPTPRNCRRIAEFGDGWAPITSDPAEIAEGVAAIRAAFAAAGRDPDSLQVRAGVPLKSSAGKPDWSATIAGLDAAREAGVTMLQVMPGQWCSDAGELPQFYERLASLKE